MNNWYFLIDNTSESLDQMRIECATQHGRNTIDNELSESISFDGQERLVKVTGGNEEWQANRTWLNALIVAPLLQGDEANDELRARWAEAQVPEFDSNEDGQPDSSEQRRAWWQNQPL